jgi:hypothetical protein
MRAYDVASWILHLLDAHLPRSLADSALSTLDYKLYVYLCTCCTRISLSIEWSEYALTDALLSLWRVRWRSGKNLMIAYEGALVSRNNIFMLGLTYVQPNSVVVRLLLLTSLLLH